MDRYLLRILLISVALWMATPAISAQSRRDSLGWEKVLSAYQVFCEDAVAAKSGDKTAAQRLRPQAEAISSLLQQVKGSGMTPSQQKRFTQMKQRYAGFVTLPELPAAVPTVVQVIPGQTVFIRDTVVVVREVRQTDTVRIVEQVEKVVEVPVDRIVEVPVEVPVAVPVVASQPALHYLLLAQVVVPDFSYGLMAGVLRTAGIYVRFDSNFRFPETAYACSSDGQASYGQIWTTGRSVRSRLSATGGALWHPATWLTLYAGAGYGWHSLCWEDISGKWAQVSDVSPRGLAADLGVIVNIDRFALSVGVTTLSFRRFDCVVGLGWYF